MSIKEKKRLWINIIFLKLIKYNLKAKNKKSLIMKAFRNKVTNYKMKNKWH